MKGPEELPVSSNSIRGLFLEVPVEGGRAVEAESITFGGGEDEEEARDVVEGGEKVEKVVSASKTLENEDERHISMSL